MPDDQASRKLHWETVYGTKSPTEVSWYQPTPRVSLEMIRRAAPDSRSSIIDVGGGASLLVDRLLEAGYQKVSVLDVSGSALDVSRKRLGARSKEVEWIAGDMLDAELQAGGFDVWHDRAVFHFLLAADDRRRYVMQVRRALRSGGHAVIATFAADGPTRCSGLEVCRYAPEELPGVFGEEFTLLDAVHEDHRTPAGGVQKFQYSLLRFKSSSSS